MGDTELLSVQLEVPIDRGSLSGDGDLHRVATDSGEILVAVHGDKTKPAILTYHDMGLNCMSFKCFLAPNCIVYYCSNLFLAFFSLFPENFCTRAATMMVLQMKQVSRPSSTSQRCERCYGTFACITWPRPDKKKAPQICRKSTPYAHNHSQGPPKNRHFLFVNLPRSYVYPTMDELAAQLLFVLSHFGLRAVIGFGVGSGANILARFAFNHSDKVDALCLINCGSTTCGWMEWGYQSFNARYLRSIGMTQGVVDYLMWHHFGRDPEERNHDLAAVRVWQREWRAFRMCRTIADHRANGFALSYFIGCILFVSLPDV